MTTMKSILTLLATAALANAHGYFVDPPGRQPGKVFAEACGQQAYYNMEGSINGNIQGLEQVVATQSDYNPEKCHLWMCKGMKYLDNTDNVQHYHPSQRVPMYHPIIAPHTGTANVSLVSIPDNTILVADLKEWDVYASTAVPTVVSQENFTVTIPEGLGGKCAEPGRCVIQMFWDARSVDQTYESCVDVVVSEGSGKGRAKRGFFGLWGSVEMED